MWVMVMWLLVVTLLPTGRAFAGDPVCSRGDIILCDGFEGGGTPTTVLSSNGRYGSWDWNTTWDPVREGTVLCDFVQTTPSRALITATQDGEPGTTPFDDHCSLYWHATLNAEDGIYPMRTIPAQPNQGAVYARFYIKYSANFLFNPPGAKVFYIRSNDGLGNYAWSQELGSGPNCGQDCSSDRTVGRFYIDLRNHAVFLDYNAGPCASNPACAEGKIRRGVWYAVEMLCIPNSSPGVRNGTAKLWINGVLVSDYANQDIRLTTDPINAVWISAYVGGPTISHPSESMWYDDVVVSRNFIGPKSSSVSPGAPTALIIN